MSADIVILLVLVGVIVFKLRSILGTKADTSVSVDKEDVAKIFEILDKSVQKSAEKPAQNSVIEPENVSDLDKALAQIPNFDKDKFINNAKKAFEIIVVSFSKEDTQTLKPLLSKSLFKKFNDIILQRQADEIRAETDFIGFKQAVIVDAKISKNETAKIVVKFVSEQVNLIKNNKNEIIEGDENFIQSITDNWTFEKDIKSSSPIWLLSTTKKQ